MMENAANHPVPEPGRLRRTLATVWATLDALSSSSGFDYTLGRIEHLEREVKQLRDELRQSRAQPAHAENNKNAEL